MFTQILVPVDLAHQDALTRARAVAGTLAKSYGASITYVGVTSSLPGSVAHSPEEFSEKLDAFAAAEADKHGVTTRAIPVVRPDPAVDLEGAVLETLAECGADLIVMASHVPTLADHLWPSNGGRIATHADVSVFVVR